MKNIFLLISFLFCAAVSFAQYPIQQSIGSKNTQVTTQGALGSDSGYVYRYNFTDTLQANFGFLKNIPGIVIRINDTLYIRNNAATKWNKLGGGGSATGQRFGVLGEDNVGSQSRNFDASNLEFTIANVSDFRVDANSELNLEAGDSLRLIGIDSGATSGLYVPFINPTTGTITKGDPFGTGVTFGSNKSLYGDRYVYNSATVIDNTPSASATIDASGVLFSGGAYNLLNWVTFADSVLGHIQTISGSFIPIDKTSTSHGIVIALDAMDHGASQYVQFLMSDTAGYINVADGPTLTPEFTSRGTTTFKWSAGDTIDYEITRISESGFIKLVNRSNHTSTQIELQEVQTSYATFQCFTIGGTMKVLNNIKMTYYDVRGAKIAFGGNSISFGATARNMALRYQTVATAGLNGGVIDFSAAATQSIDGVFTINDVIRLNPEWWVYSWAVNDRNAGVATATFKQRVLANIVPILNAGINVFIMKGIAQNSGSMIPYNDTLQSIADSLGLLIFDTYTITVGTGTNLNPQYDWGDGVHLNSVGNQVVGEGLRQFLLENNIMQEGSPITSNYLPIANSRLYYNVGADKDGNLVKSITGTDPGYLWATPEALSALKFQNANAYANVIWAESVLAGGNQQNGGAARMDNTGVVAIAGHFKSSMTVGATLSNANRFDVQPASVVLATKTFDIFNGSRFTSNSQPFTIDRILPQSGTQYGLQLRASTSGGGVIQSGYRPINVEVPSGTTVAYMDRLGGWNVESASGYNSNINGLLTDNSWITKRYADSSIAAGGGSLFARSDSRNNTAGAMAFSVAGQDFNIDSIQDGIINALSSMDWVVGNAATAYSELDYSTVSTTMQSVQVVDEEVATVETTTTGFPSARLTAFDNGVFDNSFTVADTIRATGNIQTVISDTTAYKPLAINTTTGAIVTGSWFSSGGGGGSVAWNAITNPTGDLALTFDAGESTTFTNSNTTEDLFTANSSTVTTSSFFSLNRTSTALAAGNNIMELISSGANGTSGITATGLSISVTNTGTTSTNVGLSVTASGASTNTAISATGIITATSNVTSGGNITLNGASSGFQVNNRANPSSVIMTIYGPDANGINFFSSSDIARLKTDGEFLINTTTDNGAFNLQVNGAARIAGSITLPTAGNKLNITTGSNASVGQATLVGGTVTVNTTAVTASSLIYLTVATPGGTQGNLSIGTITAATSFVINSTSGTETSVVNYWIIN